MESTELTDKQKKQKIYYIKTREHRIAYARMYNKKHKEERHKNMRKYVKKNKERINNYNKKYKKKLYASDECNRQKQMLKTYHAQFVRGKHESFKNIVGMSSEEFKAYIEGLLPEGYNWENYTKQWRIGRIDKKLDVTDNVSVNTFFYYKNIMIEKINIDKE